MFKLLIISEKSESVKELSLGLAGKGFLCSTACTDELDMDSIGTISADLAVVAIDGAAPGSRVRELPGKLKAGTRLPVVALLSDKSLDVLDSNDVDDFVMEPWDISELTVRARRILHHEPRVNGKDLVTCGDIALDTAKCEVSLRGKPVDLTFREYELLRFLMGNRGRVFSRDALLDKVWGYDFYGGDRTVDVHIRRLRSKLGESNYIETVRNIGYRFKDGA